MTVPEPSYLCLIPVFWCGWSRHNKNIPSLHLVQFHILAFNIALSNNISCLIHVFGNNNWASLCRNNANFKCIFTVFQLFQISVCLERLCIYLLVVGVQSETCQYPVLLLFDPFTQQHLLFIFIHDHIPKNPFAMWCTCPVWGKMNFQQVKIQDRFQVEMINDIHFCLMLAPMFRTLMEALLSTQRHLNLDQIKANFLTHKLMRILGAKPVKSKKNTVCFFFSTK